MWRNGITIHTVGNYNKVKSIQENFDKKKKKYRSAFYSFILRCIAKIMKSDDTKVNKSMDRSALMVGLDQDHQYLTTDFFPTEKLLSILRLTHAEIYAQMKEQFDMESQNPHLQQ